MGGTIEIVEDYCQWSHIMLAPQVTYVTDHSFWHSLKRQNSVVFPLHVVDAKMVRDWIAETFDEQPRLKRIRMPVKKAQWALLGFRLEFEEFDEAVLCRLRWL